TVSICRKQPQPGPSPAPEPQPGTWGTKGPPEAHTLELPWDCSRSWIWECLHLGYIVEGRNQKTNQIKTSKYNVFTFLPLNLFEQFQRVANAYFVFLLILQLIPQVSSLSWFTTVVPLVLVLAVSAVKDATDDYVRSSQSHFYGNGCTALYRSGAVQHTFTNEKWMKVQVGDIIKLENNNFVTADLLLLSSSEPNSLIYIETAELDGETNLKVKQALTITGDLGENLTELSQFDVVPISLYVSVEIIRLGNSFYINWDRKMYYPKKDTPAEARTTTLNEELGQIKYIFSDKTGTLTQNIMTFNKCSINGNSYGECIDTRQDLDLSDPFSSMSQYTEKVDFSYNSLADPKFFFHDHRLVESVKMGDPSTHEFFRLLALCHTAMSEEKKPGELVYQAQSPDEGALVTAARNFGFVFRSRTPETITVVEMGVTKVYNLLAILDFNNERKRMSVIVQSPEGRLTLYCKGADTIVYELLDHSSEGLKEVTTDHLNEFAGEGLRTLVLAYKDLDKVYFANWKSRHHEASTSLDNREEKLAVLYEEIEKELKLIGASAIEDKLQDGVPQTIETLTRADIKIWVLTGDKQETAENIGYSCNMLQDEMKEIFIIKGSSPEEVEEELRTARRRMNPDSFMDNYDIKVQIKKCSKQSQVIPDDELKGEETYGIIINGHSLVRDMGADTAHIGVGISGQEGMQAVLSSDFSFAQFRYLQRLLLVHGRWSYNRMCQFLRYFFYKNFTFTLVHFWYGFFCGFSAQTVYDEWFITMYNLVYTSLPVLGMSLFDQDVDDRWSMEYPQLYEPGQKNRYFNKKEFVKCVIHGIYSSLVLFFVPYGALYDTVRDDGKAVSDYQSFALMAQTCLLLVVSVQIALDTAYWTAVNQFFIWGSLAVYFAISFTMYSDGMYLIFTGSFPFIGE
ncbi:hypothetical protein GDO81_002957, partial [Engystomops pustulosus]